MIFLPKLYAAIYAIKQIVMKHLPAAFSYKTLRNSPNVSFMYKIIKNGTAHIISNSNFFEANIVWISCSVSIFPLIIFTAFRMIEILSPPLIFADENTVTKSSVSSCFILSENCSITLTAGIFISS